MYYCCGEQTMNEWKFETINGCPRYTCPFPFGPAYVEAHGPNCMAKERQGVWRFHCQGLTMTSALKAKDGPEACREASEILSERLRYMSEMVKRAFIPQPEEATRKVAIVTEVTFDSLENRLEAAIRRAVVGVFLDSESMTAWEKATRFIAQREMATEGIRFTGWDKCRYPRYEMAEHQAQ